jgi:acyl-CoA thioesterase-1
LVAQTVLILGDSLSAGYGLPNVDQGWVSLLQQKLEAAGDRVVNASISGDTTAGGLSRITSLLDQTKPSLVVVELGANDGLRALSPVAMKTNLNGMIKQSKEAGATVVLVGMRLPPNYGPRYADAFEAVFPLVAAETAVSLVPFLLEDVAGQTSFLQQDGLHPNAAAQPIIFRNVWRVLEPLLGSRGSK